MKEWMAKNKLSFLLKGKFVSALPCFGDINKYKIIGSGNVLERIQGKETTTKVCRELDDCVTLSRLLGLSRSVFSLN